MMLKALMVACDGLEDRGDLLAIIKDEAKCLSRTYKNVKDTLYSAKCGVYAIVFKIQKSCGNSQTLEKGELKVNPNILE